MRSSKKKSEALKWPWETNTVNSESVHTHTKQIILKHEPTAPRQWRAEQIKVQNIYQAKPTSWMILSKLLAFSSFLLGLHFYSGHWQLWHQCLDRVHLQQCHVTLRKLLHVVKMVQLEMQQLNPESGMVAQACDPALQEVEWEDHVFKDNLAT